MDPSPVPGPRPARLLELDALRGIAATGVMLFHYGASFPLAFPDAPALAPATRTVLTAGSYGLLLFFAISGFVIALTLGSTRHVLDFVVRRFARLYPVYWAAMLVTLAFVHLGGVAQLAIPTSAAVANVTMVQGLLYLPSVDGVYWTLAVELCFYACMVALWSAGALRRPERIIPWWLGIKVLCGLFPDTPWHIQMLLVVDYIPFFLIGILCHRVWTGERRWRDQLPYLALILAALIWLETVEQAACAIGVTLVLGAALSGRAALLRWRPLLWMGSISYALYLVHDHVGFVVILHLERHGVPPGLAILIAIAVAVGLAALLRRWVERPAERAIVTWWKQRGGAGGLLRPAREPGR